MEKVLKHTFGLDITDSALTAVELELRKGKPVAVNYSRVELAPGIVEENSIILNPEAFKEALTKLLNEGAKGPIKSKNVVISIPEEKTFSHYLSIPAEQSHHEKDILENAKDFVPIDLSEATMDYKHLENEPAQKEVRFDFVAAQKSIVESLINVLEEAGLKVVAVDALKNSLARTCQNSFLSPKKEANKAVMLIDIGQEKTTFIIHNSSSYTSSLNLGGSALKESLEPLLRKAKEFCQMVKNQEPLEINAIYILGSHSQLPGLNESLKKVFPEMNVVNKLEYIQIGEETEKFYANSIGLALRAVLPGAHKEEINLLPKTKKEELFSLKLTPVLRNRLAIMCLLFAVLMVFTGMKKSKSYFDYVATSKEVALTLEKIQNPYLNQTVQTTQQKVQFENQINSLLEDALPASWLIQKIDGYNLNGISLVNVAYYLDLEGKMNVHMRAKTVSRSETEKFLLKLEKDPYFSEVVSPLSNLVDRGERFIQIDLVLDKEKILEDMSASDSEDPDSPETEPAEESETTKKSKPKPPTLPSAPKSEPETE